MFGNTNFNTSSMVALSTTRADEVLVDVHNSAYGPTDNQPTDNRSNAARSVRFQSPLINNRVVLSSPKPGSNNNPFFQIDKCANVSKADDQLMELLALIHNYVRSRNQGHSGYNGQAAYNQYNRGYESPTQPSSDLSLVRHDAHTEYPTGRVPCTPSSFRLFNDIVKKIPKFDGKPNTLKLFCTAVEEAVEQLPFFEQKIVRALQPKLVGDAQRYKKTKNAKDKEKFNDDSLLGSLHLAQKFEAIEEISNDGNSDVDADGDVSMLPLPEPTAKARAQEKIAEIVNAGKIQLKPAVPPRAPAIQVENLDLQRTEYQSACGDDLISFEEDPCDSTPASASAQSSIENNNSQFNAVPESILDFNKQEYIGRSFPEIVQEKALERGTSVNDIEISQDIGQPNDNNNIIPAKNFDTLADEPESWNRPWMKSSKHCDAKIVESPEQYRCAEAMPSVPLLIPTHNSIPREAQLGPRTIHGTHNMQQVQIAQHGPLDYDEQTNDNTSYDYNSDNTSTRVKSSTTHLSDNRTPSREIADARDHNTSAPDTSSSVLQNADVTHAAENENMQQWPSCTRRAIRHQSQRLHVHRSSRHCESSVAGSQNNNNGDNRVCYRCHQPGHISKNCFLLMPQHTIGTSGTGPSTATNGSVKLPIYTVNVNANNPSPTITGPAAQGELSATRANAYIVHRDIANRP
ncbi:unnamed protein product, partial [Trichogramma brassicae]